MYRLGSAAPTGPPAEPDEAAGARGTWRRAIAIRSRAADGENKKPRGFYL